VYNPAVKMFSKLASSILFSINLDRSHLNCVVAFETMGPVGRFFFRLVKQLCFFKHSLLKCFVVAIPAKRVLSYVDFVFVS
jgi:hypothetical protein